MRKPDNQTDGNGDESVRSLALVQSATDRLIPFPTTDDEQSDIQQTCESVQACPSDMADYLAEILASLETMAQLHRLKALSRMLTMAREQAEDDALSTRLP